MLSYHNDENLKNLVVLEMKKHQEQDQFIKGVYGEINGKFKGCAVGCTIDSINVILGESYSTSDHNVFEESIGIPEWLARLQDTLFEGLLGEESSQFAVDFLSSIPVGVNLESIKWKFCAFILKEGIDRVINQPNLSDELREKVVSALRGVLNLHEVAINTNIWDEAEAKAAMGSAAAARSVAWSAWSAWSVAESMAARSAAAARSVAESAAAAAVWSAAAARSVAESVAATLAAAAEAAVWSAWSVAESAAARSVAESAAAAAAYKIYSDELIRLLKGA